MRMAIDARRWSWRTRAGGRAGAANIALRRAAPFAVALALLLIGYWFHAPGSVGLDDYQRRSYEALNYSDVVWLYLRDGQSAHPRPYLDYGLEYPALTGGLIYLLGFAGGLDRYFAATYAAMALCALATIALLGRLPGARPWALAIAPGLLLYTGLNWDFAALAAVALALVAYERRRDGWGTVALLAAVWLKFFPIVFLLAIAAERLRRREYRAVLRIGGLFALGSAAINLPLAARHLANWGEFFTLNAARRPEPSLWTLLPPLAVGQVGALSLALLIVGAAVGVAAAWRAPAPATIPLGAGLLLWWLLINKVYSPQYALWIYVALALLGIARPVWLAFALFDLAYYYASFQILFTATLGGGDAAARLVAWQVRYLLQPLVLVRLVVLLLLVAIAVVRLRGRPASLRALAQFRTAMTCPMAEATPVQGQIVGEREGRIGRSTGAGTSVGGLPGRVADVLVEAKAVGD